MGDDEPTQHQENQWRKSLAEFAICWGMGILSAEHKYSHPNSTWQGQRIITQSGEHQGR